MNHSSDLTDTLIKPVQTKLGLSPDGVDGPITWRAIATALGVGDQQASPAPTPLPAAPGKLMVDGKYTGIIDLSHGNSLDLGKLLDAGFGAIIHKASEGTSFKDPKYTARKSAALSAGLLFGAYHFASKADGHAQAENFLAVEDGSDPKTLLVLDFEPSSNGAPNMTLQQARDFLSYVHAATGRWPMVYGGGGLLRDLLEGSHDDVFANCHLWLCDIRKNPQPILPMWPKWTLLQYCGDGQGQEPMDVPGSDGADRNSFAGSLEELRAAWPFA